MIPPRPPLCLFCSRFFRDSALPVRCQSFPRGIPDEIFDAQLSHVDSLNGEAPFDGVIPPGWEQFGPGPDEQDCVPEEEPRDTSAGWTPARRLD